jgi:hypothetical protein
MSDNNNSYIKTDNTLIPATSKHEYAETKEQGNSLNFSGDNLPVAEYLRMQQHQLDLLQKRFTEEITKMEANLKKIFRRITEIEERFNAGKTKRV